MESALILQDLCLIKLCMIGDDYLLWAAVARTPQKSAVLYHRFDFIGVLSWGSQGIVWPYHTWFLRIFHRGEMKRCIILRNTSLEQLDTGEGHCATTEISESSLSQSRKINIKSMLLNPSQRILLQTGGSGWSTSWNTNAHWQVEGPVESSWVDHRGISVV